MTRLQEPAPGLDLRHLAYFLAVAEEGSFRRASQRLNVAQSALSRRIMALERAIGFSLFERTARGVIPSAHGHTLMVRASSIIERHRAARARLRRIAAGEAGALRIGVNHVAPQLPVFARAVAALRRGAPEVELTVTPMPSARQLNALLNDELDFGFLSGAPSQLKDLDHIVLDRSRFVLVTPVDHPLAARERIGLEDLAGEPFVFFARANGPAAYDDVHAAFARRGVKPRIVQEAGSEDTQLGLVAAGAGLAFTYDSAIERYRKGDLAFRPVEGLDVVTEIVAAWRRSDRSPLTRRFVDAIRESRDAAGDALASPS